jgi:predicted GNAT superfamily acetyltransferase
MTPSEITIRDLHVYDDYAAVVVLQRQIWGRDDDNIPTWMLAASMERGAVLIGAALDDRLIGFVYSVPGLKHGQPMQWSHMLGVLPEHRASGVGRRLKLAQRERTLARGLDLIEWTFDPLVATNGNLNVTRLGCVVEEYLENVYGASASPLHGGLPTDRFVASWRIGSPHVQRRLDAGPIVARDASVARAGMVLETTMSGDWRVPAGDPRLDLDDERVFVEIPYGWVDMLQQAPADARAWRMTTRRIFTTYFGRSYRVVDFVGNRESGRAGYLLKRVDD